MTVSDQSAGRPDRTVDHGRAEGRTDEAGSVRVVTVQVVPIGVSGTEGGHEVTVTGRIDAGTVPHVREALHRVVDHGHGDVVLLLGQAEIGDVTGLGCLVGAHHRARRAGRRLVIAEVSARSARVLRLTHLDRVLVGTSTGRAATVAPLTA